MYDSLQTFMRNTWDGISNATIQDLINQADHEELVEAEGFLHDHPEYLTGIPFPGDDQVWDMLMLTHSGAKCLQSIVDLYE
jgi:hypothetical protein